MRFTLFQNLVPTLLTNSFFYLRTKDNLWIVDPIDGTTNFAHGIPLCGIIIAYASKGELLYGCIYDPFRFLFTYLLINSPIYLKFSIRNELFDAYKNQGAYLNGKRITCCKTNELKQSVVCTGSPPNFKSLEACLRYCTPSLTLSLTPSLNHLLTHLLTHIEEQQI